MLRAIGSQDILPLSEQTLEIAFLTFLVLWTIAFGAAIGSFLNVIIYRMPRGTSLVRPKSQCPRCGRAIRARDNLPVIGWLLLRGRCRDCAAAISIRYPLVEGMMAILLLALAWCEVFRGGVNLPGARSAMTPRDSLRWQFETGPVALLVYHTILISSVMALGWIAWDRFRPPRGLVAVAWFVGVCFPLFVSGIRPADDLVPAWLPEWALGAGLQFDPQSLIESLVGILVGLAGGALVSIAATSRDDRAAVLVLGSVVGLYLGPLAVATAAPLAAGGALLLAVASRRSPRPIPAAVGCSAAILVQIFAWRWLVAFVEWASASIPTPLGRLGALAAVATVLTTLLALTGRAVGSTSSPSSGRNADSEQPPSPAHLPEAE